MDMGKTQTRFKYVVKLGPGNLFSPSLHSAGFHHGCIPERKGIGFRKIEERKCHAEQDGSLSVFFEGRKYMMEPVNILQVKTTFLMTAQPHQFISHEHKGRACTFEV